MTEIIEATIEHKEELVKIYEEFIVETDASRPESLETSFEKFLQVKDNHLNLILSEKKVAGFIEFRDLPLKLRDDRQKVEITSLFVRPEFRKSGLGGKLIQSVIDYAGQNDRDRIVLYSGMELENAHQFYERLGFRKKAFFFELRLK